MKEKGDNESGDMLKKVQERRSRWCSHMTRREDNYVGRRATEMKVQRGGREECLREDGWTGYDIRVKGLT